MVSTLGIWPNTPFNQDLSEQTGIPISEDAPLLWAVTPPSISFEDRRSKPATRVEFNQYGTSFQQRKQQASVKNEPLLKAIWRKAGTPPSVIDATAGLCQEALLIASSGCQVIAYEQNPVLFHSLSLARSPELSNHIQINKRCTLYLGCAIEKLASMPSADVIYCDPMFPPKRNSAKVSKQMAMIQTLSTLFPAVDAEILVAEALKYARSHVVVKRPQHAPTVLSSPSYSLEAGQIRFDVYDASI